MAKVIACIDGALQTQAVCDYGIWAARRLQAPLEFLHVLDRHPETAAVTDYSGNLELGAQESLLARLTDLDEQRSKLAQEHGRRILQAARQRAEAAGLPSIDTRQRHGSLVETVVDLEAEARVFILGQHRPDPLAKSYLNLNGERVVRATRRPVLITTGQFRAPAGFMIAFDGSATGRSMVQTVAKSPLLQGLECHVVMVAESTPKNSHDLAWAQECLGDAGFDAHGCLIAAEAENALREHLVSNELDLLVMGAYGHSRIRELIVGSTTTTLLRTSPVPVLIMR